MSPPVPPVRPTPREGFNPNERLTEMGLGEARIALGLAGVGGGWGPVDEGESVATIRHALERGIGVFDTAPSYVSSEKLLGQALVQWRGKRPLVSTKVGRLWGREARDIYDYSTVAMRESVQRSLDIIGVPQIDLLFLHEPQLVPAEERRRVVEDLQQMQADGLVRRLGLGGGHGDGWDGFVETGAFDVAMLFRRLDPVIFDGLAEDVPRLRKADVLIYGASPLHMGLLGARFEEFVRERPDWVWGWQIDRAVQLGALAKERGMSLASLAHRYMFGLAEVDRVVIGASTISQLDAALEDLAAGPLEPALFDEVCSIGLEA